MDAQHTHDADSSANRHSPMTNHGPVDLARSPLRTAAEIAALLDIPEKSVLYYARDGRLPCVRIGKHVRFVLADVEAAVAASRTANDGTARSRRTNLTDIP